MRDLDLLAAESSQQFDVVITGNTDTGTGQHHVASDPQHIQHARSTIDQVPTKTALRPAGDDKPSCPTMARFLVAPADNRAAGATIRARHRSRGHRR